MSMRNTSKSGLRARYQAAAAEVFSDDASIDVPAATEILQARILHALFSNMTRDLVLVKGGIAMQMLTGSKRSTTDIDLASEPKVNMMTLVGHMRNAIQSAMRCGILEDASMREQDIGGGGLSPKFHVNGRLAGTDANVHIKVEISRRDLLPEEAISRFEYTPPQGSGVGKYLVRTYSPLAVAASKTAALLDNKRYSPRDLYDLNVLMDMEVEAPVAMLAALGHEKIDRMLNYLWQKVASFSYQDFQTKVAPHLPLETAQAVTENAWTCMQIRVGEKLESWLTDARAVATEKEVPRSGLRDHYDELKAREQRLSTGTEHQDEAHAAHALKR